MEARHLIPPSSYLIWMRMVLRVRPRCLLEALQFSPIAYCSAFLTFEQGSLLIPHFLPLPFPMTFLFLIHGSFLVASPIHRRICLLIGFYLVLFFFLLIIYYSEAFSRD
ncbi:hypothetical protein ASPWEDRAFT_458297 [Aspergillus wentii DTO 134E9]|uniref:Transmembrane protein n=1 Tax=Aspergillus wentii DTO 134E9 TaxID=1073089 RepID=A0A1L9RRI1_ASPWE|nr:uncharacterized protein ASPWEDRAFT_458297 [Aspergillus wentii DTO 134E9]OJJ37529.1 hypothetical protein ASPWEDRAFT_458297 [Aspergillus wentii DTO 134E9]